MIYILGPCAIEDWETYETVSKQLVNLMSSDDEWYLKGSFDKANRSSIYTPRGVGLEKGIEFFKQIKKDFPNIKTLTDIHEPWQAEKLKDVIDVIQIPAFLCRQTDLIIETAKHFNIINVKKGQWLNPYMSAHIYKKIKEVNPEAEVWITERGTTFGYERLLVDFSAVDTFKETFDKVIFDVTHSTQKFGSQETTGGNWKLAEKYFKVAPIFGYDGIFAEVHPDPSNAISDKDSQIPLKHIDKIINETKRII